MTAITVAMTEAYFRKPPANHIMSLPDGSEVLASSNPWHWNEAFGLYINERTGQGIPGARKPDNNVGSINAEVLVTASETAWQQSDLDTSFDTGENPQDDWWGFRGLRHPTVVDTKTHFVDGVAQRLRGDGDHWRTAPKDLKRAEQLRRSRTFMPSDMNAKPSEHMPPEDQAHFIRLAKEIMANMAHLTGFLPFTGIMGPRWAQRMLEMVEREMKSLEDYGKKLTEQIVAEHRARGGRGVPEINDTKIEKLERRRAGIRFQYYHCQMLFHAWRQQFDEVCGEAEMLANSLPGVEWNGRTYTYKPLRERVDQRIRDRKETDRAWKAERMMLIGRTEQDFYRYLEAKTRYQPRNGVEGSGEATHEVAQPWSDTYSSHDDEQPD